MKLLRNQIIIAVIFLGIIVLETSCEQQKSQPVYNGKSLSAWLRDVDNEKPNHPNEQAREAIRQIGTNALPFLLKEINDPGEIWSQLGQTNSFYKTREAYIRRSNVTIGFNILGPIARPAVPALVDLLNNGNNPGSAADALVEIDPQIAAVALTDALTNKATEPRLAAAAYLIIVGTNADIAVPNLILCLKNKSPENGIMASTLGDIHARPDIAVPALIRMLNDEDFQTRVESVRSLGEFGTNAISAVPYLERAANGQNRNFDSEVKSALKQIQSGSR